VSALHNVMVENRNRKAMPAIMDFVI
jgi:hypothetical protein